jgi:HSP20 family protein
MLTRSQLGVPVLSRVGDIDRWFDEFAAEARTALGFNPAVTCGVPPMNAWVTEEAVFVEAELPGFSLDKVELTLVGRELTIRGEREEAEVGDARVLRRERPMGSFVRSFTLPVEIENEGMQATLKDGVLRVRLPRAEAHRPRRIEVRAE